MTEAYIFISSLIILGGTFLVDYLSNKNSTQKSKYVYGILYLLISSGLIFQLTNYLHTSPIKIWILNVADTTIIIKNEL